MKAISSTVEQTDEERVLEILVDQAPVGACIIQDGKFCYANCFFLSGIGYTLDELMYRDSLEIVVSEDREIVRESTIRMLKSETISPYQFRVIRRDGSIIWVMATARSIQYHGRQAVLGNYIEITDRKLTEEALQVEKNKLQALVGAIEYGLTIQDRDYNIIYQNEASRKAYGGNRVGEKCYRAYASRDKVCPKCPVAMAFRDGKSHTVEKPGKVGPSGQVIFWENTANPIRDAKGEIISCLEVTRNITERKQAEEARREAEEETIAFLEEAPVGIIHTDLKANITYVNKRFESETGYLREETIGKNGLQLDWFPVSTKKYLAKRMAARLEGRPAKQWETRFKCRDGQWIWIELEGRVLRKSGVPAGFQLIAGNITERKRAEEALRQSEEKYRSLVENITDVIYAVDKNGVATYISPVIESCLGYSPSEITGRYFGEFIHQEDLARAMESFVSTLSGTATSDDYRCWTKSGDIRWMHASNQPILEESRVVGAYGVLIDITERKQAEEALAQSQERYRTLTENASEAIFVAQDGMIKFMNPKGEELSGYSIDELTSKPFAEFIYPDDRAMVADNYVKRLKGEPIPQVYEFRIIRKDGDIRWGELNAVPISWDNGPAVLCFMNDVTERRQVEEQLRIADRLASLGELASGIAHELNNPLTGIIGLAHLLKRKDLPEDIKEDVQLIYSEAQRTANVVKGLLAFYRKHPPTEQKVNINEVIGKVLELRIYEQRVSNIETVTNMAPDLPEIWGDFYQLQQVFLNIVANAEYFMLKAHDNGTLTITTERVGDIIRISLADDGQGILQKDLRHIFDPFFTTKEVGQGTGLGLSISHGIVAAHSGRIYAESKEGEGATFVVELPIRQKEAPGEK